MAGQNQFFGSKKQIFPGSAQKCPESIDFDTNLANSGRVAKIQFLGFKRQVFPGSAQKCPESIHLDTHFANSGRVPKIQFLDAKSRFSEDRPKTVQNP